MTTDEETLKLRGYEVQWWGTHRYKIMKSGSKTFQTWYGTYNEAIIEALRVSK